MKTLTYTEARALLEQVVAEKGEEHQVELCQYAVYDPGAVGLKARPSCIVGHVFAKWGMDLDVVFPFDLPAEHNYDGTPNSDGLGAIDEYLAEMGYSLEGDAMDLLIVAQEVQDGHGGIRFGTPDRSWGAALQAAIREVPGP